MSATFPTDWRDEPCFVVAIPRPLIPFVGGLLKMMEMRGFWASDDDYLRGYTAVLELERCLMSTCLDVLIEQNNALYRMLNTALFGVTYDTVSTDPLVVTPAIAPHVTLDRHNSDGLLFLMDRLTQLTDNSINGTETPLYSYTPSVKDLEQSIVDAVNAINTDEGSILSELETIALLVG